MSGDEIRDSSSRKTDWMNHTLAECVKKHECDVLFMETMQDFGPYCRYYDLDSFELLDEKIAVMTALKEGKRFKDIPGSFEICEKLQEVKPGCFNNPTLGWF